MVPTVDWVQRALVAKFDLFFIRSTATESLIPHILLLM